MYINIVIYMGSIVATNYGHLVKVLSRVCHPLLPVIGRKQPASIASKNCHQLIFEYLVKVTRKRVAFSQQASEKGARQGLPAYTPCAVIPACKLHGGA